MKSDLIKRTAREVVALLARREVSPLELIDAALARIAAVEPLVNALPTLCPERARQAAAALPPASLLAGLPLAIKDLADVAGVRSTRGSPLYSDHVPERSNLVVERLERSGGIVLAKSNTPEFGAGANTFNEVFGRTLNPWNRALTCSGSSGGSAVALATGELWLAHGSDLGGSLRTPAGFCSVVGLRPSPGRVAAGPRTDPFDNLSVEGPMGRTVGDVALMLDAMVGSDPGDPLAFEAPQRSFISYVDAARLPKRIAFTPDLGGFPVAAEVKAVTTAAARRIAAMGVAVEEATPDLHDAEDIFTILRAHKYAISHTEKLRQHRDKLKPEVIWNIERGLALDAAEIARAVIARGALFYRVQEFFRRYELLLLPVAPVLPFPVEQRYVTEVEGHKYKSYIDWVSLTYAITLTGCPAISIPCGFSADGRPVGLQVVAPPREEGALLAACHLFEAELDLARLLPIDPRPPQALG